MSTVERGYTLPEMMLAMTFGSLIALSAAKTFPIFRQQSSDLWLHSRLEWVLHQLASDIEKDLRRSGFCAGQCKGQPLLIGHATGEAPGSCVIIAYDLNRNGHWESTSTVDAEYFGYRLRAGALEGQRGVTQCQGNAWERLLDQQEVQIDTFSVVETQGKGRKTLITLNLSGRSTVRANIQHHMSVAISKEAL